MQRWSFAFVVLSGLVWVGVQAAPPPPPPPPPPPTSSLDNELATVLQNAGFTGRVQDQLPTRLGRNVNTNLADLGRFLFFDTILGLNKDNSCAGCHSPLRGFGDTQAIAIGVDSNRIVGRNRKGPRNGRRAPIVLNTAFYPKLMWNARFVALSGNPFDNSAGFQFPAPENRLLSYLPHLLAAQAFMPPTVDYEMAGFALGTDHNFLRGEVLRRLNLVAKYKTLFGNNFPAVRSGQPINFDMIGLAIAEFEISLTRARAPIDLFARGQATAMTPGQKAGALVFFGKAGCINCHKVSGSSNEMFSDFLPHAIGVPQLFPQVTNSDDFSGPAGNEDYGYEEVTGNAADRYKFRTSPLRNVGLQPWFFHDGAFDKLEDAIRHHLNPKASAASYSPARRVPPDLAGPISPIQPIIDKIDPLLAEPVALTLTEFQNLVDFVRFGLLDPDAVPARLARLIPPTLPSGQPPLKFQP